MFLGLLIGLTLWGLLIALAHSEDEATQRKGMRNAAITDSKALEYLRLQGFYRILGLFAFMMGLCGSIGWIIEVLS